MAGLSDPEFVELKVQELRELPQGPLSYVQRYVAMSR